MRLLITTDTVGGVWNFTTTLTEQLLQHGHAVHLVSFGRQPSAAQQAWAADLISTTTQKRQRRAPYQPGAQPQDRQPANTRAEGPPHSPTANFTYTATTIPLEWMQTNDRAFEEGQTTLLNLTNTFHPELILSNQFCFGRLATNVPRVVVAHSDVLSWARACDPATLEPTPWLNRYTALVQSGLLSAAALAVPSAFMAAALKASFFLPANAIVIPNGAKVEPAQSPNPERKLQAITAGRLWDKAKGLDTLRDLHAPFPLLVAGDQTLDTPQTDQNWPQHLKNLGPLSQPDLHRHFRESAIYLCTSRYEPFGLAPLEAALCGCALVLRDLPSLREIWADNALYFTDQASLQTQLQRLATDPHLLADQQQRTRTHAAQYTPERMADGYLHLFHVVLQLAEHQKAHAV